jgi:hypothetical protein
MANVEHRVTEDGTHEIVVSVDGYYVPFARLDANRVEQLVENAAGRDDKAKASRSSSKASKADANETGKEG